MKKGGIDVCVRRFGRFGFYPRITRMNGSYGKKSGKSLEPSRRHASLGIITNIAVGTLGF